MRQQRVRERERAREAAAKAMSDEVNLDEQYLEAAFKRAAANASHLDPAQLSLHAPEMVSAAQNFMIASKEEMGNHFTALWLCGMLELLGRLAHAAEELGAQHQTKLAKEMVVCGRNRSAFVAHCPS